MILRNLTLERLWGWFNASLAGWRWAYQFLLYLMLLFTLIFSSSKSQNLRYRKFDLSGEENKNKALKYFSRFYFKKVELVRQAFVTVHNKTMFKYWKLDNKVRKSCSRIIKTKCTWRNHSFFRDLFFYLFTWYLANTYLFTVNNRNTR